MELACFFRAKKSKHLYFDQLRLYCWAQQYNLILLCYLLLLQLSDLCIRHSLNTHGEGLSFHYSLDMQPFQVPLILSVYDVVFYVFLMFFFEVLPFSFHHQFFKRV